MNIDEIVWNGLPDRSDLGNVVQVIYDAAITGFRPVKSTDMGGAAIIYSSGASISGVVATGIVNVSSFLIVGGIATSGSLYYPNSQLGSSVPMAIDRENGGIKVSQNDLDRAYDTVSSYPPQALSASNYTPFTGDLTTQYISGNANRKALFVQNVGTGTLFIKFGSSAPNQNSYSMILAGGAANTDGNGSSWSDWPAVWIGGVYFSGVTNVIAWEV
jgi:hypothetical protein